MKRKVAVGMTGNFRGVCPILNRAIVITNTVCDYDGFSYTRVAYRGLSDRMCCVTKLGDIFVSQAFFNAVEGDTHG